MKPHPHVAQPRSCDQQGVPVAWQGLGMRTSSIALPQNDCCCAGIRAMLAGMQSQVQKATAATLASQASVLICCNHARHTVSQTMHDVMLRQACGRMEWHLLHVPRACTCNGVVLAPHQLDQPQQDAFNQSIYAGAIIIPCKHCLWLCLADATIVRLLLIYLRPPHLQPHPFKTQLAHAHDNTYTTPQRKSVRLASGLCIRLGCACMPGTQHAHHSTHSGKTLWARAGLCAPRHTGDRAACNATQRNNNRTPRCALQQSAAAARLRDEPAAGSRSRLCAAAACRD